MTDAQLRAHMARKAVAESKCACDGKHDPYWALCPLMLAQCELDDAIAALRAAGKGDK